MSARSIAPIHPVDPTLGAMIDETSLATLAPGRFGGLLHRTPKLKPADPRSSGWFQGLTVRHGFSLMMSDVQHAAQQDVDYLSQDHLKLHFKLDGNSIISGERQESPCDAGVMAFLVQPPNTIKHERTKQDSHLRAITIICSREFVAELLPASDTNLPSPLIEYLKGPVSTFSHGRAPLDPQLRSVVEDLLNLQDSAVDELMLEAKALELLCLSIRQLSDAGARDLLKPRNRRKVRELCALLESKEGMAMNITQLCRTLAWNETQMMESFKLMMGTTISSYRQKLRMEHALRQLRTTDLSVTDIAFDAGYEHPSNFATAFKRTYGFSPKAGRARLN